MARAELELQTVEPDPTFAVDAVRLSTAAAPVRKRGGRARWMTAAAALLVVCGVAFVGKPYWDQPFTEGRSFDDILALIELPPDRQNAQLAVGPVSDVCLRCVRTLRKLGDHQYPSVADAAMASLGRFRTGEAQDVGRTYTSYVAAVFLARDEQASEADLLDAVVSLESLGCLCLKAMKAFEAHPESDAGLMLAVDLDKFAKVVGIKD